jgi:hypothetical protein
MKRAQAHVMCHKAYLEYVVSLAVEYHDTLIEVMMFHGAGGV